MAELLSKAAKALKINDDSTRFQHCLAHLLTEVQTVYVDEAHGSDETGNGTQSAPWKTPLHAVIQLGGTDKGTIMIRKEGAEEYTEIAKAASKKLQKTLDGIRRKEAKATAITASSSGTAKDDNKEDEIVEDKSLPAAVTIKIRQATAKRGGRVVVKGWVNNVRVQSRKLVFVDLRDGSDEELQCVLAGKLVNSLPAAV